MYMPLSWSHGNGIVAYRSKFLLKSLSMATIPTLGARAFHKLSVWVVFSLLHSVFITNGRITPPVTPAISISISKMREIWKGISELPIFDPPLQATTCRQCQYWKMLPAIEKIRSAASKITIVLKRGLELREYWRRRPVCWSSDPGSRSSLKSPSFSMINDSDQ